MTRRRLPSTTIVLRSWLVPNVRPADLARAAGVSRQYVDAVLKGKKPPSRRLLEAARTLGIPVPDDAA
jgi:transcriptional regulator with XRE-family HTH domain